jgi:hypothetical protein
MISRYRSRFVSSCGERTAAGARLSVTGGSRRSDEVGKIDIGVGLG